MVRPANPSPDLAETAAAVSANTGITLILNSQFNAILNPPIIIPPAG